VGLMYPIKDHYLKLEDFALGSLDEFLHELNYDTAMGWSLDNRLNQWGSGQAGNFNYGREMLEKFTVGRFDMYAPEGQDAKPGALPNYNEEDVASSAKLLSGFYSWFEAYGPQPGYKNWNVDPNTGLGYEGMNERFSVSRAYGSDISIFATRPESRQFRVTASSGDAGHSATADQYMDLLLYTHPATARRIAYSIFGRFAYPHPPEALVDDLAQTVLASNYDMKAILRRVLNSSAMFTEETTDGCIKSPLEHLAYVLRTLQLPMNSMYFFAHMNPMMVALGMPMFEPATVFGFHMCGDPLEPGKANHGETWLSAQMLLNRGRTLFSILKTAQSSASLLTYTYTGSYSEPGEAVSLRTTLFGTWGNYTAAQVVDHMTAKFNLSVSAQERTLLINYLSQGDDTWNPGNAARVEEKLRGLSFILGMHPKNFY
ncbi:MAG: DUF1800 family protein, partial [Deltaproteobacteria bacterium]|nr:DUF1800 family protein [Deltaproteobacteria bacterium]